MCIRTWEGFPLFSQALQPITRGSLMDLRFRTDMSGQTVQTQIRLLLKKQSDQGLHCLNFSMNLLEALLHKKTPLCEASIG